jgi:micrococcal nuclease
MRRPVAALNRPSYAHRSAIGGAVIAAALAAIGSAALADPCKAIPDKGPMPEYLSHGATFSGRVIYVGDGDSLCVDVARKNQGLSPRDWVEVRIANFYAPELGSSDGPPAKRALENVAMGRRAVCRAQHRSHDRVVATCTINGRDLADLMRRSGVREGGNGWGQ